MQRYLNKNQGLHSESSRNLLGIKGAATQHHTAALRHRHRGLIVDEPIVPARSNGANGSSLMLGGHLNPIGQAGGQSADNAGGGDVDEGETKEETHLLKQVHDGLLGRALDGALECVTKGLTWSLKCLTGKANKCCSKIALIKTGPAISRTANA